MTIQTDHDLSKHILITSSNEEPFRLELTKALHLKSVDWTFLSVNLKEQSTWPVRGKELVVIGDCKYTPQEIEILPGILVNNPENLVLWLRCTHPPTFLPKGQIVAQIIPTRGPNDTSMVPVACPVQSITEERPRVTCEFTVGGETLNITALLDTEADVTIVPAQDWPSHWALQDMAGHVQGVGGLQLARQSKSVVQIKGPKGQLANIRPFVLNYKEPLLGRDLMAQWGVKIDIPDPSVDISTATIEERPTKKLNSLTDNPVWVEQWPLSKQKLKALEELVEEQLRKGYIVETDSPWNSPVFVIQKPGKDKWRLLQDLRQINNVIEDMGSLQPGMPSPTMLPQNWQLAIIDIKDCFFQIPLHPDDAPRFAFSVPTINREAPRKRYHWRVLPQGMKNSPVICQWYVASLLSPVRAAAGQAIIHHYMDDVLVCAPTDDVLSHALDLTINALIAAGFELQEEKVQRMPPWKYLGLEIGKRTIVLQKLAIKTKWKDILKKDQDGKDPLSIIEWVFLSHQRSKRMTRPQELVAELIRKARFRIRELAGWEKAGDVIKHLIHAFSFLGIPKELKTDNGPAYKSREICSFLQQLGVEHKTGIPHSPTGQTMVERTHGTIKRVLHQQQRVLKVETPAVRLARALFTINFLNCSFEGLNPPIIRHFGVGSLFSIRERPPVMVRDPESGRTEGPHDLVTWGRGYACMSTPTGPRWIPSKWFKHGNHPDQIPHSEEIPPNPRSPDIAQPVSLSRRMAGPATKTLGELAHLECWVAKQANLTSNALANLLSDEEITRQATLQNRAAIDYLLLLHGHRCEEFEGLCCFNLSSKAEDIHTTIRQMREMVTNIKRETDDWLSGLFTNWGISGWVSSIIKTVLLCLFVLLLIMLAFGLLKRMLYNIISATTHSPSVNHVIAPTEESPEEEGLELEEVPEGAPEDDGRGLDEEEHGLGYPTQHH
ncbi:hypothetical protein DUI87_01359 [Hirundo rustica rustica]|uniref:ribonuclease H n=1 Tax=Hirundo rustica rustica TaxID=333673 RepID=A0A3M0L517_HIRRU|nr:hypothetical protein DUI87_01359 [Hirundo rustica rustica]